MPELVVALDLDNVLDNLVRLVHLIRVEYRLDRIHLDNTCCHHDNQHQNSIQVRIG